MENIRVIVNDGHNVPMFQLFRDFGHLAKVHGLDLDALASLEQLGECRNDNGELLVVFGPGQQLYTQDFTADPLDLG